MQQAEDRSHRLGQKNAVTVTYLDAKDTIDEHIARVLKDKQRLIDSVVDDRHAQSKKEDTVEVIDKVIASMMHVELKKTA